jgi:hypothetical protein
MTSSIDFVFYLFSRTKTFTVGFGEERTASMLLATIVRKRTISYAAVVG